MYPEKTQSVVIYVENEGLTFPSPHSAACSAAFLNPAPIAASSAPPVEAHISCLHAGVYVLAERLTVHPVKLQQLAALMSEPSDL